MYMKTFSHEAALAEIKHEQPAVRFDVLLPNSTSTARPAVIGTEITFHLNDSESESASNKVRLGVTPGDDDTNDVDTTDSTNGGSYQNEKYQINIELMLMGGDKQTANNYMTNWGFKENATV